MRTSGDRARAAPSGGVSPSPSLTRLGFLMAERAAQCQRLSQPRRQKNITMPTVVNTMIATATRLP
jgi:hypothetical protein